MDSFVVDSMLDSPYVKIPIVIVFCWFFMAYVIILTERWYEIEKEIEEDIRRMKEEEEANKHNK
jgi:hypothetical protein